MLRSVVGVIVSSVLVVGCSTSSDEHVGDRATGDDDGGAPVATLIERAPSYRYPSAPPVPTGATPAVDEVFAMVVAELPLGGIRSSLLRELVAAGDARHAWLVADLLRFLQGGDTGASLVDAFEELTGVDPSEDPQFADAPWTSVTNHLLAWDLPAPDGYQDLKASLFVAVEARWEPLFADADAEIDWRWVSWGGVLIDDRPLGDTDPCPGGCIPALDDPPLTAADEGDWYPEDALVFGVVVGDDVVAFPKNIMEVHEMVNITIGGRRLAIPYCTLCRSAQAYFTDDVPDGVEVPVVRTSGLLSRSNKVMFDLVTYSVFDTFTGRALSGPLRLAGVELEETTVVTTTWGEWRSTHPSTRIVAEDGGLGRAYALDPLRGRDAGGPIFPIGDVDGRLAAHELVVGVIDGDGVAVAFAADAARVELAAGRRVEVGGVELYADGGGLRANASGGDELVAHEAFWFAWSQFHPTTALWLAGSE